VERCGRVDCPISILDCEAGEEILGWMQASSNSLIIFDLLRYVDI